MITQTLFNTQSSCSLQAGELEQLCQKSYNTRLNSHQVWQLVVLHILFSSYGDPFCEFHSCVGSVFAAELK